MKIYRVVGAGRSSLRQSGPRFPTQPLTNPFPVMAQRSSTFGQAGPELADDRLGHQPADVATVLGHLADEAGGQERVQRVGRHEQRLDLGDPVVHLGHLHLVVEVADRPQALDHGRDAVLFAEVDQQPVEAVDPDIAELGGHGAQHLDALVHREQALLGDVDEHRHDDLVVEPGRPADDVEVPVGDGVKGTGADDTEHADQPFCSTPKMAYQSVASPYLRDWSGEKPSGQHKGSEREARSTITSAPGASHPRVPAEASTDVISSPVKAYGGSAKATS